MDLSKYIGREYERYNCFDLAKEFYLDIYGLELKNYFEGPVPSRKDIESLVITNKGDFIQVEKPEFGDLVIIKLFGYSSHMAIYIGEGKIIHSMKKVGSGMESLAKYSKMVDGFYRHRELGND
jgi:hypothetical protein